MTRKDTILIAVVINAGLLAILFATAIIYDTDKVLEQTEIGSELVENENAPQDPPYAIVATGPAIHDEVDQVLKYYTPPSSDSSSQKWDSPESDSFEPLAVHSQGVEEQVREKVPAGEQGKDFIEVTVKKGDVLEKIARANGTTISAIKKLNNLQSEKLSIGQVLKIPLKNETATTNKASQTKKPLDKQEEDSSETVYYIIKSGDNPWKVAKQFNVKYDDILRLNQMDEDKARNLKIGDRIRVK